MKEYELRLGVDNKNNLNGGLCLDEESSIKLNQSPYNGLLNMCLDNGGQLTKRPGQSNLFTSLGTGPINGIYGDFKGYTIFAWGTNVYKQRGTEAPTSIYSGVTNAKCFFFTYNSILYLMNGSQYLQYDGTTMKAVVPYAPRVSINRKPDGSNSVVDESWNMIGNGFRDSFNGDGTTKTYQLSLKGLDSTTVTCNLPGVTEGAGMTVDRTAGTVTFTTAPASGNNNVEITAYKNMNLSQNILKCTKGIEFSNRIFVTGNSNLANYYFCTGLTDLIDASYFPQKYMYAIRGSEKAVTGFKVHYNKLVVFKEDLTCTVTASTGLDNTASFPIEYLNTEIGCDIPDSIQLVNNNIIFANTYGGVFLIVSTQVIGEKSVLPISQNINENLDRPGLLAEPNLKTASSVDHNYKYYLCVNGKAYVLDYRDGLAIQNPDNMKWFLYDNINANNFAIRGNELLYGDKTEGKLVTFTTNFHDFGQPIKAIYSTKLFDFGIPDYLKTIKYIWYTLKANSSAKVSIKFLTDNSNSKVSEDLPTNINSSFKWSSFNWNNFTWNVLNFAPTIRIKARLKKIKYFQVVFENNTLNENLTIINLVIQYTVNRRVK